MRSRSSTDMTPIRYRGSHTLLSTMFEAYNFVLMGEKIIMMIHIAP